MKVAIISDIHNNETNLKKVLDYCENKKIKKIICCGDLASDETLDFMADNFNPPGGGEIFYTFGNMDNEQLREFQYVDVYKNVNLFRNFGEIEVEGKQVAFVHFPDKAKRLAESGKYDFVFYGHTHKPWTEIIEARRKQYVFNCTLLNPGNVAGEHYLPTFATWNTEDDKFELIRVHDLK
ncbi:MAG: YfcE family phosphodiesterase [Candidatus Moranbacteria bacterium]|jgi:putative phosphoesterase|nr:YfcE family phosphodiesterase [Candidatus Moranbacteria bacterium]